MTEKPNQSRARNLRMVIGGGLVVALSLVGFYLAMRPSTTEFGLMALFLGITSAVTILAGFGAYRLGWMSQSPSIVLALMITYILSSLLTLLNVWLTARLMFASQHDLVLGTILLLFAGGMAIALGWFFATTLGERIESLRGAARKLASGDLGIRVKVQGRDELAELSQTFNEMAEKVEAAAQEQQELDQLRHELLAWTSHDLQTPLASMRAMIEALADGMVEDESTRQRYLTTIQREIQSLSALIDDLLQVAQIDAGGLNINPAWNSLSDLISDTLEAFSELASQQGVQLTGEATPDLDPTWFDAPRIGRVLANLIQNALQYTQHGGKVKLTARKKQGEALVEIRDDGEGIKPADLPMIFESFYRGEKSRSRATGGSGLGLAIAKGLVEAHGGMITVRSEPGKGTSFIFSLPSPP
jgi:signal transduction histidine kinase